MIRLIAPVLLAVAACGNIAPAPGHHDDAATPHDAALDSPEPIDAAPDAPPLKEGREFVSGGVRMTSTTYTFDVQVGHSVQQGKTLGSTYKLEGNAAVKP